MDYPQSTTQRKLGQLSVFLDISWDFLDIISEQYLHQAVSCFAFYRLAFHTFSEHLTTQNIGYANLIFPLLQTIQLRFTEEKWQTEETQLVGLDLNPKPWILNPICFLNASKKNSYQHSLLFSAHSSIITNGTVKWKTQ